MPRAPKMRRHGRRSVADASRCSSTSNLPRPWPPWKCQTGFGIYYIQLVRADALLGPAGWNTSHKRGTNGTDIASEESRLQLTVVRRIVSVVTVSSVATVSIGSSSAVGRSQRQYRATPCHQASRAANRVFRSSLGGLPRRLALRAAGPWRKPVRRIIATGARGT